MILAYALVGTALANPLGARQAAQDFTGNTQNGLMQGACKSAIVIFARGTTEGGNVGTLAGPPTFQAIAQKIGPQNLAVQGVEYPADVPGFLDGGDKAGSKTMADLVTKAISTCPKSNIVMAGYSQGCQLVHNAAKALPAATTGKTAALCFGDPDNGQPVQGVPAAKTKIICHADDNICQGGSQIKQAHLTYGKQDAGEAASFVASLVAAGNGTTGAATGRQKH
ncbi:cutinase-domain-containing protein [Pseudomassariella vexata]|uniref:cutinase n=1 Tax=Pseudomassariella vexata TaxID=1141098 RepID=A0A1Y2D7M0_9PEZI|nr:cutinase-domain-containing protein [Pseudomassariella vexata]ORY55273.1 cutinase-domain-containing protein [Pseudomassariella vexata]